MMILRLLFIAFISVPMVIPANGQQPQRVVETDRGVVVAAERLAAESGAVVLREGGNAIDAAVATALTMATTYPRAGNLGGGGFMMIRLTDGTVTALDFRERAPAAVTRDLYIGPDGKLLKGSSTMGHRAAGVPGTVSGLAFALEKYGSGRFTWARLITPAQELAENGFTVSASLAEDLVASTELFAKNAAARRVFLRDGNPYRAGETFKQPELAATLARLRDEGPQEFYNGLTAEMIEADMRAHDGLITRADLAAYRTTERKPLQGTYRGYEIFTMPPPSSGGVALFQMLGMLEPLDVSGLAPQSAEKVHLWAEVMRRAYSDRAAYLGDPDFTDIPVSRLLDRDYLAQRMQSFHPEKATLSRDLPGGLMPLKPESTETTHFSIMDSAGNAVSCTYTINGLYGCGVVAGEAGFLLNNEMDDFTARPGTPNAFGLVQSEANAIQPHKRPLSSMTPVIVVKDGKVAIVTGSPGGSTIINTVFQVLTNLIDHKLSPREAVDLPRFNHQWLPDAITYEEGFVSEEAMETLKAKGHVLRTRKLYPNDPASVAGLQGSAETIVIDPTTGRRIGVPDLRRFGTAAVAE